MRLKKAFTMAEAIMVMVILGIIATILISTMKPTEFRDRGYKVLAKKILGQVDAATTQILFNHSRDSQMTTLYDPTKTDGTVFNYKDNTSKVKDLYAKYLVSTRETVNSTWCKGNTSGATTMKLKDGSCLGFKAGGSSINTRIPGEAADHSVTPVGLIYLDVNDAEEPNIWNKDQYLIPIDTYGIAY